MPRRPTARRIRRFSVATRLAIAIVAVSATAIAATSAVGLWAGGEANDRLLQRRLVSIAAAEAWELRATIEGVRAQVGMLAASPATAEALDRFGGADRVAVPDREQLTLERDALRAHVRETVLPTLERATTGAVDVDDLLPDSDLGIHLQHAFVPTDPGTDPIAIDVPDLEGPWAAAHAELHPRYRTVLDRLGADDLYLIDPAGDIVYSVAKRTDFATNVAFGTHSSGTLGLTFRRLRDPDTAPSTPAGTDPAGTDPAGTDPIVTDMAPYAPALGSPAWFISAPVVVDGELAGMLAVRLGIEPLHDVLVGGPDGRDALGFGETGELYLAGPDRRLRTDPRGYRDDPRGYVAAATEAGTLGETDADVIDARGSTVLVQRTDGDVVAQAGAVLGRTDHLGRRSLMHATELDVDGLDWVLVSQITRAEVDEPLDRYRRTLLLVAAVLVAAVTFGGVAWANRLALPVRAIGERLRRRRRDGTDAAGEGPAPDAPDTGTDLPDHRCTEFARLADGVAAMDAELTERRAEVARAHDEWVATLRALLPAHVASRIDAGDTALLELAPAATVTVLVLHGADAHDVGRADLDAVLDVIDTVAERHAVERVKLLGDSCFTVVGHRQPLLDHARRAAEFAREVIGAVDDLHGRHDPDDRHDRHDPHDPDGGIALAAGLASGPVSTGLGGSDRLVYDVWGRTATIAYEHARRAGPGTVEIDASTAERLPAASRTAASRTADRGSADPGEATR